MHIHGALKHPPVSGNCPWSILCCRNKLTSGNMWVKQVVKITPPPKQDSADKKNCPLGDALWPILQHLLSKSGTSPKNSEIPPSNTMDTILACIVSMFASVLNLKWGQWSKQRLLLLLPYQWWIKVCYVNLEEWWASATSVFYASASSSIMYLSLMYVTHRYLEQIFTLQKTRGL